MFRWSISFDFQFSRGKHKKRRYSTDVICENLLIIELRLQLNSFEYYKLFREVGMDFCFLQFLKKLKTTTNVYCDINLVKVTAKTVFDVR